MVNEQSGVLSGVNPMTVNTADPLTLTIVQVKRPKIFYGINRNSSGESSFCLHLRSREVVIIVVFTRLLHLGLKHIRQPRVISEVLGGIILGPTIMGHIPGYINTVFPSSSLTYLNLLANFGLVLYLFLVGLELNPTMIKNSIKSVALISASGILLPFALGVGVAYGLYDSMDNHHVGDQQVPFTSFLLFICVAMAITAFPVLARILSELKLMGTSVGNRALSSAVGDDITAWILLALVIAIINATNYLTALYSFLLCVAWTLIVGFVIRPILLRSIVITDSNKPSPSTLMIAITLSVVLISAFVTNIIGIHYIFGGFIVGVILPHEGGFTVGLTEKIEDIITVLFLPIYFTLSGLKTNISDLGAVGWGWAILVIIVAMVGKVTGCTIAAKLTGSNRREALTIGVFMSCKGLVELIILNLGYDAKIINGRVFSIMVIMALVTTFVTTPLATYLYPVQYQRKMERERSKKDLESANDTNDLKLLAVLDKVENLPAMITFVQLLQHNNTSAKSGLQNSDRDTGSDITQINKPMNVHVLRLVELTQRMSAVMKFNEISETILHDPIMNMFSALSQVSSVKVEPKLSVAAPKDFCREIIEKIQDADINLVIIPWGGAGEIEDAPIENRDHAPREKKNTSPQVSTFIQNVFSEAAIYSSVAVFVDRGFGSTDNTHTLPNPMGYLHIFVPFFGGADDREALTFVFRLLEYPNVNVTVVRIIKSEKPTDNDVTLIKPELQSEINNIDDVKDRPISTISISEAVARQENEDDESFLEMHLKSKSGYPARNARINYKEVPSYTPIQTAVDRAKEVVNRKDLVVVGRSRHSHLNEPHHHYEFKELIKNLGYYGNETHKSLGYVSEAFLVGGVMASLLVLQAKQTKNKRKRVGFLTITRHVYLFGIGDLAIDSILLLSSFLLNQQHKQL
ncbi:23309_t:CDS:2 [Cetraspora pellucida]|uniref:23309_t:CDS:1 n=1 Tax=Cetraspora pellucida TaxID=1433469 RepID=A0A9N8YU15_9GLOM|nr:23309_t:CDS:2 [Cetraspora pellucida]